MKTVKKGPINSLAFEYEKALTEFKDFLALIPHEKFLIIEDGTIPLEFQSARNIVLHVVNAGYGYANYIRKYFNNETNKRKVEIQSTKEAVIELEKMFQYTLTTFEDLRLLSYRDLMKTIIKTSWSTYDLEALIEHAIVHVLRHHRQIERTIQ